MLLLRVFLRLMGGDDFGGDVPRNLFIADRTHFKRTAPLGHAAQFGRVFAHFGVGHFGFDHLHAFLDPHAEDAAALVV